jgi:hypothetical protein
MLKHEIRQSSVVQGTGPGAMTVLQEGLTVMIPGLDAWYRTKTNKQVIPEECRVYDENLQDALGVKYFALPPAAGISNEPHSAFLNATIFPRWVTCSTCKSLYRIGLSEIEVKKCQDCVGSGKKWTKSIQVNFVMVCKDGHLDEFPWLEWVHSGTGSVCRAPQLKLESKGSGDLKGQRVSCSCGQKRTLDRTASTDSSGDTFLTKNLNGDSKVPFKCTSERPWLREKDVKCNNDVRMILRNSNNIYYSVIADSILVPPADEGSATLFDLIEPKLNLYKGKAIAFRYDHSRLAKWILDDLVVEGIDENELIETLQIVFPNPASKAPVQPVVDGRSGAILNLSEWDALNKVQESHVLTVRDVGYVQGSINGVSKVSAVPVLNKTTALKGFKRLIPGEVGLVEGKNLLRRDPQANAEWLPAVRQVGEGIFLAFEESQMREWESQQPLIQRIHKIEENLTKFGHLTVSNTPSPRSVFLHTLAHALIQEFVLECGYTAAALAERIYSGENMAGILIYTASSDADGTMGGLVELARPDLLSKVFEAAVEKARWCSNDPVCMELGRVGQGHHGTNLAACHSCSLLPETACQNFNQSLDRATLVGDLTGEDKFLGFFQKAGIVL